MAHHTLESDDYDLICVGFGPASLSIAVALHDGGVQAKVLFIERQQQFAWHEGMLLPGTHMQISYLKDMATFRDPRSNFTFLNYLHANNRLVAFTNQSTFYPLREEFNDYLCWCAAHFDDYVHYGEEVTGIAPATQGTPVKSWKVTSRKVGSQETAEYTARHVVVAVGGKAMIPELFQNKKRVIHSSQYMCQIKDLLPNKDAPYNVAVVGGGQSAVEIFQDLGSRYPQAKTNLILRSAALKPSDDSPFVNEIFDPDQVDKFYALDDQTRRDDLRRNKATNYSVVRLELIEKVYGDMYRQRLHDPNEKNWQHRLLPLREILKVEDKSGKVDITVKKAREGVTEAHTDLDLVVLGTGYLRNMHQNLLLPSKHLAQTESFDVDRNYRVQFREGAVSRDSGIWLQGCCEATHGLSDSLLSILAIRGGEMVDSIFHPARPSISPAQQCPVQLMAKL